MTRAKMRQQPETIAIRYDLHELPTAQHKAGLAGLLLQIDSMKARMAAGALPSDLELPTVSDQGSTSVKIGFTERAVINLYDDLYDAEVVEQLCRQKKQDKEPKRIIEVEVTDRATKKVKKEKRYIYDAVQPAGQFLRRFTDDGKECWCRLWRDMITSIPRNQDATMGPFKDMAQLRLARGGEAEWERMVVTRRKKDTKCYLHCREGMGVWEDLLRFEKERGKGHATTGLSGALLIGTQDQNAECLPFINRIDHALLLHFWTLAARIFVPEMIDPDGQRKFVSGFVLAFPDVSDLPAFCRAYLRLLGELKPGVRGCRPAEAAISIPEQGALEFMHHLADLAERTVIQEGPARFIAGVEFFYMVRIGQNVKLAANGRIPPRDILLQLYAGIRANFRNPVFQSSYLLSVIRGKPWFAEFEAPMTEREWSFFVHSTQEKHRTPTAMIGFAWEADLRFQQIDANYQLMKGEGMMTGTSPDEVDRLVYQMIGRYAHFRTLARLRFEADDPKQPWMREVKDKQGKAHKRETPEYQEERRKVCSSLYLELRSRNAEDFVEHFSNALSAVANYLPEDDFATIAAALMRSHTHGVSENRLRNRDDVKTLTLLALSAHSRSLFARADAENDENLTKENEG
ncbi:MAG: type I-MYXAN CRISPR-associated protein Cmx8 [Isosphaeraceae bacterium]|nr:type I-MYXAN CRISPR-associated protein Cmx8 [Isosphaeraceae bacterium]